MRIAVFSTKPYDREFLEEAARGRGHELPCLEPRLTAATARLAEGFPARGVFVNEPLARHYGAPGVRGRSGRSCRVNSSKGV